MRRPMACILHARKQGHLTDMLGTVTIHLDYHSDSHYPNCIEPESISSESSMDWTVEVVVFGDRMRCKAGDFSFEATRR
jgi:hypothetical protein